MEAGNFCIRDGRIGPIPRLWRASLYFLSTLPAAWPTLSLLRSMGLSPWAFIFWCNFAGLSRICFCAPYGGMPRSSACLRRGLLHGQSQRSADDLFAGLGGASRLSCLSADFFLTVGNLPAIVRKPHRDVAPHTAPFSAVFSGVWLSNAHAGVMATYSVTLSGCLGSMLIRKSCGPLCSADGGLSARFRLAAFYIVPAGYERAGSTIAQALSQD